MPPDPQPPPTREDLERKRREAEAKALALARAIVDALTPPAAGTEGGDEGPLPTPGEVAEDVASLGDAVERLETQVTAMGEGLTDLATALANMKMGVNFGLDAASIGQVLTALQPAPVPPVDAKLALEQLTLAISQAERALNDANFMMSTVNVSLDLNLMVGDKGVKTTVTFQITPKPIS